MIDGNGQPAHGLETRYGLEPRKVSKRLSRYILAATVSFVLLRIENRLAG
jgi:hypothetical protein